MGVSAVFQLFQSGSLTHYLEALLFFPPNYFNGFVLSSSFQQIDYLVSQYNTTKDKALSDLNSEYFDLKGTSDMYRKTLM